MKRNVRKYLRIVNHPSGRKALPDYQKRQYDQTAQCVVNYLQSEVRELQRKAPSKPPGSNTDVLSESVLAALDSTMQRTGDEAEIETVMNHSIEVNTQTPENLNDSITKLKEAANSETVPVNQTTKDKSEPRKQTKNTKCCVSCKVKSTAKKSYDMIQCMFCMEWYHEVCVGITTTDPIAIWVCLTCRAVPTDLKNEITSIKREVADMKQFTHSAVKAIESLSTKLDNNFQSLNDRLTSMTRQINSKELCISESIESLQSTTDTLKLAFDQKSCQIVNKTNAILEKVKTHNEELKTLSKPNSRIQQILEKTDKHSTERIETNTNTRVNTTGRDKTHKSKTIPSSSTGSTNNKLQNKRSHSNKTNIISNDENEPIDLTDKKCINQTTLLVGDSILKDIKNNDLKPNTTVRSFPGATIETLTSKLNNYDIEKCQTVIVHVGSNDADNGEDIDDFCDHYSSLLDSLVHDDRRIIVSGLLPRKGSNLEPYNEQLKSLCEDNCIEFVNHFDRFLLASGELPDSYFKRDKIHPNFNGTKKLLSNIDRIIKVIKPGNYGQTSQPSNNSQTRGSRSDSYFDRPVGQAPQRSSRGPRPVKFCHICYRQGGHTTQECWFNGRTTGVPARPSR